eukprot:2453272-Prymnesium_polylepis.1
MRVRGEGASPPSPRGRHFRRPNPSGCRFGGLNPRGSVLGGLILWAPFLILCMLDLRILSIIGQVLYLSRVVVAYEPIVCIDCNTKSRHRRQAVQSFDGLY